MVNLKVIRMDTPGWRGTDSDEAWLLETDSPVTIHYWDGKTVTTNHFVASRSDVIYPGWEVLVFATDPNGKVLDWSDVAGGRQMSFDEAIEELLETIYDGVIYL